MSLDAAIDNRWALGQAASVGSPDILLVEDNEIVAYALRRFLAAKRVAVTIATSCSEARGEAAQREFSVAVIDLNLPDGSGVTLAEELLREGRASAVVFYTGEVSTAPELRRAAELGRIHLKGSDPAGLLQAVLEVCRARTVAPERGHLPTDSLAPPA